MRGLLASAEAIETYPPVGYPDPNYLLLAWDGDQPIHILVADLVARNEVIVVTAYQPSLDDWEPDFRTRRK